MPKKETILKKTMRRGNLGTVHNIKVKSGQEALEIILDDIRAKGFTSQDLLATDYSLETTEGAYPHIRYQIFFGDLFDRYIDPDAVFNFEKFFGNHRKSPSEPETQA